MDRLILMPVKVENSDRGWIFNCPDIERSFKLSNLYLGSINPGEIRGNHYHEAKTEQVVFLSGKAKIAIEGAEGGLRIEREVEIKSPMIWEIGPFEAHAIKNVGNVPLIFGFWEESYGSDKVEKVVIES